MILTSLLVSERIPSSGQRPCDPRPSGETAIQIQAFDLLQESINLLRIFNAKGNLGHFLLTET